MAGRSFFSGQLHRCRMEGYAGNPWLSSSSPASLRMGGVPDRQADGIQRIFTPAASIYMRDRERLSFLSPLPPDFKGGSVTPGCCHICRILLFDPTWRWDQALFGRSLRCPGPDSNGGGVAEETIWCPVALVAGRDNSPGDRPFFPRGIRIRRDKCRIIIWDIFRLEEKMPDNSTLYLLQSGHDRKLYDYLYHLHRGPVWIGKLAARAWSGDWEF